MMRHSFATSSLLALVLTLGACGDDGVSLSVHVVTSIVPRAEFSYVEVKRFDPAPLYTGATPLNEVRVEAFFGQDFVHGVPVATFDEIPPGEHVVQVRLLRADRSELISRRVRASFGSDFVLRVHLTPDCVGVTCPAPAGSPSLSECVAGQCVDERCIPPNGEFCPAVTFCNSEDDCPMPVASCATRVCAEGLCEVQTAGACGEDMYCDPALGCLPTFVPDAGVADAGVDADVADGGVDGGSIIDGALCGSVCVLVDDPCHAGVISCAGGSATCVPYIVQPVGSACGDDRVCNVRGECAECHRGASCSVGCEAGVVSCDAGYEQCDLSGDLDPLTMGTACSPTGACVDGETCGSGETCSTSGECRACVEGAACTEGCELGHVSCLMDGACVHDTTLPPGSGCGELVLRDRKVEYTGYCDATSTCVDCILGESCASWNGCSSGERQCDNENNAGFGACNSATPNAAASACAPGIGSPDDLCDGAGSCVQPLRLTSLASAGFINSSGTIGTCGTNDAHEVVCFDNAGTYKKDGLSNIVSVDGTLRAGCAITNTGALRCWNNGGAPEDRALPARAEQIRVLLSGDYLYAMMALLETGEIALVDGDYTFTMPFSLVPDVDDIVDISVVGSTFVMLRADGSVLNYGSGIGLSTVDGMTDATALIDNSYCVIHGTGRVACINTYLSGGLPYPYGVPYTMSWADVPFPFTDILDVAIIDTYNAMCVLRSTHEVLCFGGSQSAGQGQGDLVELTSFPVDNVIDLKAGCVRDDDDLVYCWSSSAPFAEGDLRFVRPSLVSVPEACTINDPCPSAPFVPECYRSVISRCEGGLQCATVPGPIGETCSAGVCSGSGSCYTPFLADQVAVGIYVSCAILPDGTPACWGYNIQGVIGDPSAPLDTTLALTPVVGVHDAIDIAVGYEYACALIEGGSVSCWGATNAMATEVALPEDVTHIAAAYWGSQTRVCAVTVSGAAYCWEPWSVATPDLVPSVTDAVDVDGASMQFAFLTADGHVQSMGWNSYGNFGDGTTTANLTDAVTMNLIDDAITVSVSSGSTCVVRESREVWCSGYVRRTDGEGEVYVSTPERLPLPFSDAREIAISNYGYVIREDETVWTWVDDPSTATHFTGLAAPHYEGLSSGGSQACLLAGEYGVFCGYPWFMSPLAP